MLDDECDGRVLLNARDYQRAWRDHRWVAYLVQERSRVVKATASGFVAAW